MTPERSRDYRITPHARFEMQRRGLDEEIVSRVLSEPEQEETMRQGRVVCQSRITMGVPGRRYLVRVILDIDRDPAEVVTVYRTSKIGKYWRGATT